MPTATSAAAAAAGGGGETPVLKKEGSHPSFSSSAGGTYETPLLDSGELTEEQIKIQTQEAEEEILFECSLLSRIIEPIRFTIPENRYNEVVTYESLREELERALRQEMKLQPAKIEEQLKDLKEVWEMFNEGQPVRSTYFALLDFDLKEFPVIKNNQRKVLEQMADWPVVSKEVVMERLGMKEDDTLLNAIFGVGSDVIPGAILENFLTSSQRHPKKLMVAEKCASDIIQDNRQMGSFFVFVIMFVLTMYFVLQLDIPNNFLLQQTLRDPPVGDWPNYCPPGVSVNGSQGCFFAKRTLESVGTVAEAKRFLTREIIIQLWTGWADIPINAPYGSAWLVGGLLLRLAPQLKTNTTARSATCADLNLSRGFDVQYVQTDFSCESLKHTIIPFSMSLDKALEKGQEFENFTEYIPIGETVAAIAEFPAVQASDGTIVYGSVRLAIPKSGSVYVQMRIRPCNFEFHKQVLPLVIIQGIFVFMSILQQIHFYPVTRTWRKYIRPALVIDILLFFLIGISYFRLKNLPALDPAIFSQTEWIPKDFDAATVDFDFATVALGFWILIFLSLSVRYLGAVEGVQIVVALVSAAAGETVGLLIVFANFFVMFTIAAKNLFGFSQTEFATFYSAGSELLGYWFGDSNFELLTKNHPSIGGVFYFTYKVFVVFFALNLLVAVITAPLGDVREAADLHLKLFNLIEIEVQHRPWVARFRWGLRKFCLPWCNIFFNSIPSIVSPFSHHWQRIYLDLHVLYGNVSKFEIDKILTSTKRMLAMRERAMKKARWKTNAIRETEEHLLVPDKVSFIILKFAILDESEMTVLRDARLTKVLIAYDKLSTEVEKLVEKQESRREGRLEEEKSLLERLTKFRASTKTQKKMQNRMNREVVETTGHYTRTKIAQRTADQQYTFACTQFVVRRLNEARTLPFYQIFITFFYVFFVGFSITIVQSSAFLCENADHGIREGLYKQRCYDKACDEGFTILKTWDEIEHLQDIFEFFQLFMEPYILDYNRLASSSITGVFPHGAPIPGSGAEDPGSGGPLTTTTLNPSTTAIATTTTSLLGTTSTAASSSSTILANSTTTTTSTSATSTSTTSTTTTATSGATAPPPTSPPTTTSTAAPGTFDTRRAVWFDEKVWRTGPIVLRQHRGVRIPCAVRGADTSNGQNANIAANSGRLDKMDSLVCYSDYTVLNTEPLFRPSDSLLDPSAYKYNGDCDFLVPSHRGYVRPSYPCGGYIAYVHTAEELQYVQDNWIDNGTRFLQVVTRLDSTGTDKILYHMFFELADGGGANLKEMHCQPITSIDLSARVLSGYVLVGIELFTYLFFLLINCFEKDAAKADINRPAFPTAAFMTLLIGLAIELTLPGGFVVEVDKMGDDYLKDRLQMTSVSFTVSWLIMKYVTFPLAQLFSRESANTFRIMFLTIKSLVVVLPFYMVLSCAFIASGYVLFGQYLLEFSTFKTATLHIAKGLLGDWDNGRMFVEKEMLATLYTALFVLSVMTVLANLVLSLITGAADEVRDESSSLEFVEATGRLLGHNVVSGPMYECYLGWMCLPSWFTRQMRRCYPGFMKRTNIYANHIAITERGRVSMFAECLLAFVGPNRATELLSVIEFEKLPVSSRGSAVMCLCLLTEIFEKEFPGEDALDEELDLNISGAFKPPPTIYDEETGRLRGKSVANLNHYGGGGGPGGGSSAFGLPSATAAAGMSYNEADTIEMKKIEAERDAVVGSVGVAVSRKNSSKNVDQEALDAINELASSLSFHLAGSPDQQQQQQSNNTNSNNINNDNDANNHNLYNNNQQQQQGASTLPAAKNSNAIMFGNEYDSDDDFLPGIGEAVGPAGAEDEELMML